MNLSEIKNHLNHLETIAFILPNGEKVPAHFHVTEIGKSAKTFIDCGGTLRQEKKVSFQLWNANDYDHRLHPEKLVKIIELAEDTFNLTGLEIEVEYQGEHTIEKFGLEYKDEAFHLITQLTDCLAQDACGIPQPKQKKNLSELQNQTCAPNSGCC